MEKNRSINAKVTFKCRYGLCLAFDCKCPWWTFSEVTKYTSNFGLNGATSWYTWIVPIFYLWEVMAKIQNLILTKKSAFFIEPSNLSTALILEPKGPQPYSNVWASLVGVVKFFKVLLIKYFSTDFTPK